MKKYFIKGTAKELHEGDPITFEKTKSLFNGKTMMHHLVDCTFSEYLIPLLLQQGIIEEKEIENNIKEEAKNKIFNFCDKEDNNILEAILEHNEELEHRIERLENIVSDMAKLIRISSSKPDNNGIKHPKHAKNTCRK